MQSQCNYFTAFTAFTASIATDGCGGDQRDSAVRTRLLDESDSTLEGDKAVSTGRHHFVSQFGVSFELL